MQEVMQLQQKAPGFHIFSLDTRFVQNHWDQSSSLCFVIMAGLFHSAQDHVARHTAPGRASLWRRGVADAFATMLETGLLEISQ